MNSLLVTSLEAVKNEERLAAYEERKKAFVDKWCDGHDPDYAGYYGESFAKYIDARQNYDWWQEQDKDTDWIQTQTF